MKILAVFNESLYLQFTSNRYCETFKGGSLNRLGGSVVSVDTFNKVDQWIPPELLLTEETIQAIEEESINA